MSSIVNQLHGVTSLKFLTKNYRYLKMCTCIFTALYRTEGVEISHFRFEFVRTSCRKSGASTQLQDEMRTAADGCQLANYCWYKFYDKMKKTCAKNEGRVTRGSHANTRPFLPPSTFPSNRIESVSLHFPAPGNSWTIDQFTKQKRPSTRWESPLLLVSRQNQAKSCKTIQIYLIVICWKYFSTSHPSEVYREAGWMHIATYRYVRIYINQFIAEKGKPSD